MSLALLRLEGIVHFQVAFEETGPLPIVLFGGGCIQVFFSKIYVQKLWLALINLFETPKVGSWQTCMYLIVALDTLFNFAFLVEHHNIVNWHKSSSSSLTPSFKGTMKKKKLPNQVISESTGMERWYWDKCPITWASIEPEELQMNVGLHNQRDQN